VVKFVGLFSLRPGVDPEDAYRYWREKHTIWAKNVMRPELRRYVTNRLTHRFGKDDIFGFAELWFDDMQSAMRAAERLQKAKPDEWLSKWIKPPTRFVVMEADVEL